MSNQSYSAPSSWELSERLKALRAKMKQKGASWCLIRATDRFLNEYVPADRSRRVFLTGFTGSVGDALIGLDTAYLFVDGRYALQAKDEAVHFEVKVLPLGVSIEGACLDALRELAKGTIVLVEEEKISKSQHDRLTQMAKECGITLVDDGEEIGNPIEPGRIWQVDTQILGTTLNERLAQIQHVLASEKVDAFLTVALDDIAWLSGARGADFPYQSTFASRGLVFRDEFWLMTPHPESHFPHKDQIRFFDNLDKGLQALGSRMQTHKCVVGYDPESTPTSLVKQVQKAGASLKVMNNPFQVLKTRKNKSEIDHMYAGFARADRVVFETQNWVCDQVMSGQKITEADVDAYVREAFRKSGTVELSFKPICGYAKNGAIIHHSTPDTQTVIQEGELFLLDTGGIYEGGYSTDLTRTFLVGGPNTKAKVAHKQMFTLVLKASIIGMSARMPAGFSGVQLDALVRAPFWQLGLNFAHGTGHGIGINVHEFPPRIATVGTAKVEVGHIFSVEPGFYVPQFGGVRIENLCTVVEDPTKKGFLRVVPLTFAPLDERLIDQDMLSTYDRVFLDFFGWRFQSPQKDWNSLPPLDAEPMELMRTLSLGF